MERPDIQQSRESLAAGLATCVGLLWCLHLTTAINPAHAQETTTPPVAESEARPFTNPFADATFTRTFRIDPDSLIHLIPIVGAQLEKPQEALRSFLASRGIELSAGSKFFYNTRTGLLTARGALHELDAIENALTPLSITPPQVMFQTHVAELSVDPNFLGLPETQVSVIDTNLTVKPGVVVLTQPQARIVFRALEQREGVEIWSAPTVTTLSGRQARLSIEQISSYPITDPPLTAPDKPLKSRWSPKNKTDQ